MIIIRVSFLRDPFSMLKKVFEIGKAEENRKQNLKNYVKCAIIFMGNFLQSCRVFLRRNDI